MLSPYWIYIFLAMVVLVLCILVFLYLMLKKARKPPVPAGAVPATVKTETTTVEFTQHVPASNLGLRASFVRALRLLKSHVTGHDYRYRIPWFLMIGESQSGKTTLLSSTGLNLPLGRPSEQVNGIKQALNWCFFDKGVVLDIAGNYVLREDGETSDSRGWATIARLLQKYRPERPLDGIILTIPGTDLIGPPSLSPERRVKLEHKAAALYRKLWQAQKVLGMSFPVYVLVTKCDQVTGFKSLCHEIPSQLQHDMFGWSSPYTLETAYNSSWVNEAFQSLYRYLFQIQVEVFADRSEIQDSDGLFLLPSEIQSMRAPLQVYLDQIFKESSYHDSFFFRGLYFCGDGTIEEPVSPPSPLPSAAEAEEDWLIPTPDPDVPVAPALPTFNARRPVFLKHLFERKIFQEDLLAQPVTRIRLSRNRTVLAAQIISLAIPLIGAIGILATFGSLQRQEKVLYDFLAQEALDLTQVRDRYDKNLTSARANNLMRTISYTPSAEVSDQSAGVDGTVPVPAEVPDDEENLLTAMSALSGTKFYSLFLPTSWFSDINERIDKSIVAAFKYVVFESLRLGLEERTNTLLVAPPSYERSSSRSSYPGATLSDSIFAHAKRAARPDPAPTEAPSINAVPDYQLHTFIEELGLLLNNRARYERLRQKDTGSFDDLSKLVKYLDHAPLPANFDTTNELFVRALKTVEARPLESADVHRRGALKVAEMIEGIYQSSFDNRSVTYTYLDDITLTEALLAKPEYTWLSTYVFDARSPFHDMTISSALRELRKSLESLSRQKFMSKTSGYATEHAQFMVRRRLVWDKESLRQAISLYMDYKTFIENKSLNHSENLDDSVRQAALTQARVKIAALIAQAQKYQPAQAAVGESVFKASIIAEVKNFEDTEDLLAQLMDICDRLAINNGLRRAITEQAAYLIRAIGREFMSESFYTIKQGGFAWWKGTKPLSYIAFDVGSPEELIAYLAIQRKRMLFLGRELAAPIFAFMATQNVSPQVLQGDSPVDWDEILTELDKYDNKIPGNSVAALENFIRFDMDRISLEDCPALMRTGGGQSGDYFIQIRNSLRRQLYQRCAQLAEVKTVNSNLRDLKNYQEIELYFNNNLAGRFPFSNPVRDQVFAEADPETIVAFFKFLDKKEKIARDALMKNPQLGRAQEEALLFLDRMDDVHRFFAPFMDKKDEKEQVPVFDFDFQFRTNENKEVGANQIIDWSFEVGKQKFRYQDVERTGSWLFGDPIRLSLRWANDSPSIPISGGTLSRVRVRDRTAILEFNNRWSLLYLLLKHAGTAADFDKGIDIEPYTLRFPIRTKPDATPGPPVRRAQPEDLMTDMAQVYMRVSLLAPSKKEALILPTFPDSAPKLPLRIMEIETGNN
jgi:hypothetical protein